MSKTIFWEVDAQADFMLPGGSLYVPGAEKIIPNINSLVDEARLGHVFLISSADAHNPDDPELNEWPPHCLKGSPGAELLPEACASPRLVIPNEKGFVFPEDLAAYRQVTFEKNTIDVFDNPNADQLLASLNRSGPANCEPSTQFIVFGVATEYCVRSTVEGLVLRGHSVAIAVDTVRAIDEMKGQQILATLHCRGVQLISAKEAVSLLSASFRALRSAFP